MNVPDFVIIFWHWILQFPIFDSYIPSANFSYYSTVNGPLQLGGSSIDLQSLARGFGWRHVPTNQNFVGCISNFTYNDFVSILVLFLIKRNSCHKYPNYKYKSENINLLFHSFWVTSTYRAQFRFRLDYFCLLLKHSKRNPYHIKALRCTVMLVAHLWILCISQLVISKFWNVYSNL